MNKRFTSIEEAKAVAEKFTKGKIVPARVIKGCNRNTRVNSHKLKFGVDVYRISGVNGNVFIYDCYEGGLEWVIDVSAFSGSLDIQGNPYGKGGNYFIGNYGICDESFLFSVNQAVFG